MKRTGPKADTDAPVSPSIVHREKTPWSSEVVAGLLPHGGVLRFTGSGFDCANGLQLLTIQFAAALATGTLFLDRFETRQRRVLLTDLESGNGEFATHVASTLEDLGLDTECLGSELVTLGLGGTLPQDHISPIFGQFDVFVSIAASDRLGTPASSVMAEGRSSKRPMRLKFETHQFDGSKGWLSPHVGYSCVIGRDTKITRTRRGWELDKESP